MLRMKGLLALIAAPLRRRRLPLCLPLLCFVLLCVLPLSLKPLLMLEPGGLKGDQQNKVTLLACALELC